MAATIRLTRMGRMKRPFYRVVVMDTRARRDGAYIEKLGYYNPFVDPYECRIDADKTLAWLSKGAGMSDTARGLLRNEGVLYRWHLQKSGAEIADIEAKVEKFRSDRADKVVKAREDKERKADEARRKAEAETKAKLKAEAEAAAAAAAAAAAPEPEAAPAEEAPAETAPAEEAPAEAAPVDKAPADEAPAEDAKPDAAVADEPPADDAGDETTKDGAATE